MKNKFAERLKELREDKGFNIIQLAKLLNSTVEYIASGKKENSDLNKNEKLMMPIYHKLIDLNF